MRRLCTWLREQRKDRSVQQKPNAHGLSLYVAVGQWGGLHFIPSRLGLRIVVGWVGVNLCNYDVDRLIGLMANRIETLTAPATHAGIPKYYSDPDAYWE